MNQKLRVLSMKIGSSQRNALGALGELVALEMLTDAGYSVKLTKTGSKRGDLRVVDPNTGEVFNVEVKAARPSTDKQYHFCLYKKNKTDYRHADYVLMFTVSKAGTITPFLIPSEHIKFQKHICITKAPRTYAGKWSHYRLEGRTIKL